MLGDRPGLAAEDAQAYESFWRLSAARGWNTSSPQPISMADLQAYLQIRPVRDPDDRMEFVDLMQALDTAWLKYKAENAPKPS